MPGIICDGVQSHYGHDGVCHNNVVSVSSIEFSTVNSGLQVVTFSSRRSVWLVN